MHKHFFFYNNEFLYIYTTHTMLCALHTHYPWSLDLFVYVPFQLPFWSIHHLQSFRRYELITHIAISVLPGTHLHFESSEACEGKVPCPRTQHRNNVPILKEEKHDISLKILHQVGFETTWQTVTLAKLCAPTIAPRPSRVNII